MICLATETTSEPRLNHLLLCAVQRLPRPTAFGAGADLPAAAFCDFALSAFAFLARSLISRMAASRLAWRT